MTILQAPFRLLILGRPHSGKTYTLVNALQNPNVFGTFSEYILISPTAFSKRNQVWKKLGLQRDNIYEKWSMERFEKIYNREVKKCKADPSRKPIIILDDCGGQGLRGTNNIKATPLDQALTTCTHYNISIVIMSQLTNLLPMSARGCAEGIMIYEPPNEYEAEALYKAFGKGAHGRWLKLLHMCTEKDYNFMFIDKSGAKIKMYHNLEERLDEEVSTKRKNNGETGQGPEPEISLIKRRKFPKEV